MRSPLILFSYSFLGFTKRTGQEAAGWLCWGSYVHTWRQYYSSEKIAGDTDIFLYTIYLHLDYFRWNLKTSKFIREIKAYLFLKFLWTCMWMFTAVLFIITKKWKQPQCPSVHKWINCYIHTTEYLLFSSKGNNQHVHRCTQ